MLVSNFTATEEYGQDRRFFKKRANPGLFRFIFGLFKQTIQFLQQINVKTCYVHPVYGAGIRTRDLSITRPGLPLPDIHFVHSFHCIVIVHAIAVLYQITLSVEPNVTQSFQINLITR